jgi:alpha-mannosidase
MSGTAPATRHLIECLDGNLAVSAIKQAESGDALVLRLWNPGDQPLTENIRFWRTVISAEYAALSEVPTGAAPPARNGGEITISAAPHQIVTVKIQL